MKIWKVKTLHEHKLSLDYSIPSIVAGDLLITNRDGDEETWTDHVVYSYSTTIHIFGVYGDTDNHEYSK